MTEKCVTRRIGWFLFVFALGVWPPSHSVAGPSADTAKLLAGRVLLYSVFVHDGGDLQWEDEGVVAAEEKTRQTADQLQTWASQYGVPLMIETQSTHVWTVFDIRNPPPDLEPWKWEQGWIRDAFRNTGALHDADSDQYASDDLVLWLQRVFGNGLPLSVVVIFQLPFYADPSTGSETIQGETGPFIRMYPDGPHCSVSGYDWRATAHEFLHTFGACDEYSCLCQCENAYIAYSYQGRSPDGETNYNCELCGGEATLPCLMKSCAPNTELCLLTRRQIGWGNADDDGVPDAIDPVDGLEAWVLTSVGDFSESEPSVSFFVKDGAGGELEPVSLAEGIEPWTPDTFSLPLPYIDETRLTPADGYLFSGAKYYGSSPNYWWVDSIYVRPFEGDQLLGAWRVAGWGRAPRMTAANGVLYATSEYWWDGGTEIRYARIRGDGTLEPWIEIPDPPLPTPSTTVEGIAIAGGFLYATWHKWLGYYQGFQVFVAGAPLLPDGGVGAWDSPDLVTETPYGPGLGVSDLVTDGGGLFLVALANNATRIWSTGLAPDGTRIGWVTNPNLPSTLSRVTPVVAAGRLFMLGGYASGSPGYPVAAVWFAPINSDKSVGSWIQLDDLPFTAATPGACVTSDDSVAYLWVGGGYANSGMTLHNDIRVAPLELSTAYPSESRVTYRVPLGSEKEIQSIGWRSTKAPYDSLRYRAEAGGEYTGWSAFCAESDGRIVPEDPLSTTGLEIEIRAIPSSGMRIHDVTVVYTDPNPGETPAGHDIFATLPSSVGQIRYENVTTAGLTNAVPDPSPPAPPAGTKPHGAFAISTTAGVEGLIEIGLRYDPLEVVSEAVLHLYHYDGSWQDITTHVDPIGRMVWGEIVSLSTFSVMEDTTTLVPTGVMETTAANTPEPLIARQNSPNPFNPTTTIRFSLPERSQVVLRVYDVRGRVVRTLLDGVLTSGTHTVTWDGKDERNRHVPSGMYFYSLEAGGETRTEKMTLIR